MTDRIAAKSRLDTKRYRVGHCYAQVIKCEGVPKHMQPHTREVTGLYTQELERGKGYATTLMHKICRDADACNIVLLLEPKPFGDEGLSESYLIGWYEATFGFNVIQSAPTVLMARMPGSTPRLLELTPTARAMLTEKKK